MLWKLGQNQSCTIFLYIEEANSSQFKFLNGHDMGICHDAFERYTWSLREGPHQLSRNIFGRCPHNSFHTKACRIASVV